MSERVLLVDDDADLRSAVAAFLDRTGFEVLTAATGAEGIDLFDRERPDVVLLDLQLPDRSGMDVLEDLRARGGAVVLLTGHGDVQTAVQAMQRGALNFLTKPVDLPHLVAAITRVVETVQLRRTVGALARQGVGDGLDGVLGVSAPMRAIEAELKALAESDRTTVLLTGESGTGKGRIARAMHAASGRARAPFVEINCAGLAPALVESELFGHERGAFTDAREMKPGLFEVGHHGTVFLDEIGDLAQDVQPKLLTAIETRRFRRVGGTREHTVDVRLLAATNHDLVEAVNAGRFREDLYYRISVAVIRLPPLRERTRDDRRAILERVFAELARDLASRPDSIDPGALDRLLDWRWPGNVREMRNAIERAMIRARGSSLIRSEHLPEEIRRGGAGGDAHDPVTLRDAERRLVAEALRHHRGNRTHAARELGVSRVTLLKKIRDYGLDEGTTHGE